MKKFSYRLQRVEELRKDQLKTAQQALRKARDEFKVQRKDLSFLKNNQKDYRAKLKDRSQKFIDLMELNWYEEYLELLRVEIEDKKENLIKHRQTLTRLKKFIQSKEKEKKSLERQKEKKFNHFLSELKKEEQKNLDEISITPALKKE
jgi:flagellar FliJ protein